MLTTEQRKFNKKFCEHRSSARRRKIPFLFTKEQWISAWVKSGHWEERGLGGYVMSRHNDIGPYSVENVTIKTQRENNREILCGDRNPMRRPESLLKFIATQTGKKKTPTTCIKISKSKSGTKRKYNEDGTWTYHHPKKVEV